MIFFFEHPVIAGVVPVEDKELIKKLNKMKLNEGNEIQFDDKPSVYVKLIDDEEEIIILSKDKQFNYSEEKWYVISPNENTERNRTKGYARGCKLGNEAIALTNGKCGDILCEGSRDECEDYYNNWIRERN